MKIIVKFFIDPTDVNFVQLDEAINEPWIWSSLMWGGRRDFFLIQRLRKNNTIVELEKTGKAKTREGLIRGNRKRSDPELKGKYMLEKPNFPNEVFFTIDAESLPINKILILMEQLLLIFLHLSFLKCL